jgi:hypothetical protein
MPHLPFGSSISAEYASFLGFLFQTRFGIFHQFAQIWEGA